MIKEATPTKSGQAPRPRWNRDRLRDEATKGASRGFTLLEMVVVISLVLFLLGLTLAVGVNVIERSEISRTRNTIRLLDMALREWEIAADRKLSWGKNFFLPDGTPSPVAVYDLQGDPASQYGSSSTEDIFIISELLDTVARPTQVKDIIANIDPELVHQYESGVYPPWVVKLGLESTQDADFDDSLAILDAWGAPIYPTHPGPTWFTGTILERDDDGTLRIENETEYGIAVNRQVCFVSAGPDGKFGTEPGSDEAKRRARADNIYSYQPIASPDWDTP